MQRGRMPVPDGLLFRRVGAGLELFQQLLQHAPLDCVLGEEVEDEAVLSTRGDK
jgi:hypothetical protein